MGSQKRDVEKERYWQKIIPEAVRSGMSIREFCRQRRLKESQFYWWQRRLKAGQGERTQRRAANQSDYRRRPGQLALRQLLLRRVLVPEGTPRSLSASATGGRAHS